MAYSWNGNASYLNASQTAFKMLDTYDVQVHGVNSAQEALSGAQSMTEHSLRFRYCPHPILSHTTCGQESVQT